MELKRISLKHDSYLFLVTVKLQLFVILLHQQHNYGIQQNQVT